MSWAWMAGLEHLAKADLLPVKMPGQHRAAAAHNARDVEPHRRHDHAGHDLVAVGHQHQAVQLVGDGHRLDAVGDQLAAGEAVLHADVAHRDAVADPDRGDEDGGAPGHPHPGLDRLGQLVEMDMAGHDLAVGADHPDQRAVEFFLGKAAGVKEAAVGGVYS